MQERDPKIFWESGGNWRKKDQELTDKSFLSSRSRLSFFLSKEKDFRKRFSSGKKMILNPWMIEEEEDFRGRAKRYFRRRREMCCRRTNHGTVKIWNNHQSWRSHELHLLAQFPCPFLFPMLRRRQAKKKLSAMLDYFCSRVLWTGFFLQQNFACSSNERMMHTAGGTGRSARTELGAAPKWERVEREKGRLSSPWKGLYMV